MTFQTDPKDSIITVDLESGTLLVGFNYTEGDYLIAIHVYKDATYEVLGFTTVAKSKMTWPMIQTLDRFERFIEEHHLILRSNSIVPPWGEIQPSNS